jgi:aspartate kinase
MKNRKKIAKFAKFGGTPMSTLVYWFKVAQVILNDPSIVGVTPSAPGKRFPKDEKITGILIQISSLMAKNMPWEHLWKKVSDRFTEIIEGLGLANVLESLLEEVKQSIIENKYKDFVASRGEYLSGVILTAYLKSLGLDAYFVDAKDCVVFKEGKLDFEETCKSIMACKRKRGIIILSGFYGADSTGRIYTFSRGGSDLSGALGACGFGVSVYENWTDVSGIYTGDPKFAPNAKPIHRTSYRDAHILTSAGASVLHEDTISLLMKYGITLHIRNINDPDALGTMVFPKLKESNKGVVGLACQKDLTVFSIAKLLSHGEVGFGEKVLHIIASQNIPYSSEFFGTDESHFAVENQYLHLIPEASKKEKSKRLNRRVRQIKDEIQDSLQPDSISVMKDVAVITTVGSTYTSLYQMLGVLIRNKIPFSSPGQNPSGQKIIVIPNKYANIAFPLIHDELFFPKSETTNSSDHKTERCHKI